MKNEAEFATAFGKWIRNPKNKPTTSSVYEHKHTKGGTFNLNTWRKEQGHQLRALHDSMTDVGTYKKWSDQSSDQKPYDATYLVNANTYLVIYFEKWDEFFVVPTKKVLNFVEQTSVSYTYLKETEVAHKIIDKGSKKVIHTTF